MLTHNEHVDDVSRHRYKHRYIHKYIDFVVVMSSVGLALANTSYFIDIHEYDVVGLYQLK